MQMGVYWFVIEQAHRDFRLNRLFSYVSWRPECILSAGSPPPEKFICPYSIETSDGLIPEFGLGSRGNRQCVPLA